VRSRSDDRLRLDCERSSQFSGCLRPGQEHRHGTAPSASRHHSIPRERILGTLIAVAPVVGTARTVSAGANIAKALGIAEGFRERLEDRDF
jgi:hypothetical protein